MIDTYRKLLDLLTAAERRKFYLLLVLVVVMGLVEMLRSPRSCRSCSCSRPGRRRTNGTISPVYAGLGFTNPTPSWSSSPSASRLPDRRVVFRALTAYAVYRFT